MSAFCVRGSFKKRVRGRFLWVLSLFYRRGVYRGGCMGKSVLSRVDLLLERIGIFFCMMGVTFNFTAVGDIDAA